MRITESAISLNVARRRGVSRPGPREHLGFTEAMAADGVLLDGPPRGRLQPGSTSAPVWPTFEPARPAGSRRRPPGRLHRRGHRRDYERLGQEGVKIVTPIETEPWGERYFQVTDPNGVVYQLVQWMHDPSEA